LTIAVDLSQWQLLKIMMSRIPDILYEDNHLLIVNKGVSDIVQEDKTGDESLEQQIKAFIKERDQKPGQVFLGVAHRIDRPVSGVVVFAKTSKALARMNEMFQNREIRKIYWAIVKEKPREDEALLEHFISRNTQKNKAFIHTKEVKDSKPASLHYRVRGKSDNYYLLEIELHTGRHHQIRAQLAFIGCPVKGDLKYGFARSNKNGGISLHSRSIRFIHPVKKEEIYVEAPVPENDLFKFFKVTD
jgi:23S rRNA pseudouridine1911/1915/1917 synthase